MVAPKNFPPFWDRMMALTDKSGPCWIFNGHRDECGYGRMRRNNKLVRLHREMWKDLHGPVPEGMSVCHTCDNPACINPDHLWVGTHKQNMEDKARKGRVVTVLPWLHPLTKLDRMDVAFIKQRLLRGESCLKIGRHFGVSDVVIRNIRAGRVWRMVEAAP